MSPSLFGSIKNKLSSSKSSSTPPIKRTSTSDTNADMGRNPFRDRESSSWSLLRIDDANMQVAPRDSPPSYQSATSGLAPGSSYIRHASPTPSLASVTNDDDKYAFLSQFDTIFVVDDSGSMSGPLWREVDMALQAITPICTARDKDGIDLYFLNHRSGSSDGKDKASGGYYNITNAATVRSIFQRVTPASTTPTGTRLHSILKPYVDSLTRARSIESVKPVNIIVITDGRPTDDPEGVIVQQARKLDRMEAPPHQVGIQFFQVGTDRKARDALRELDDDLADQGIRDMVDSVTWDGLSSDSARILTADHILKVVLGAVVRKLDRKKTSGESRSRT
jgi:uncharacterized protein YegL